MKRGARNLIGLVVAAVCFAMAQPAAAQVVLPDGPGRDQMVKVCGICHEPQRAASIRLTREGWEATIGDMIARGAKGSDDDFKAILDYLATNFLGEASKPLNVNTATSGGARERAAAPSEGGSRGHRVPRQETVCSRASTS